MANVWRMKHSRARVKSGPQSEKHAIALDSAIWLKVLEHFEVLPGFVELMHDISGGTLQALSQAETPGNGGVDATVFHVAYKIGGWLDHENAVYARHDFVTGDTFILVVGLVTNCLEKMQSLYERKPKATIFDALYELISTESREQDWSQWSPSAWRRALPPRELAFFNKDGYVVLDGLRDVSWRSTLIGATIRAMIAHLDRYDDLCAALRKRSNPDQPTKCLDAVRDAYVYRIEVAQSQHNQIQHLRERVRIQLDATRSLILPRLNSEIASAMKKDSELMRGIAAVTMIFLPATFVATFFSMVFLHVGDERSV
ncbi:hypothetical protein M409DRAFT_22651 [Zasmidium cellare ATCC 36951]|uniref:Uncharacterized protein n=1 Tax=Zasmidium cellare ATCC 36951 TaxID=1080233 RepID=A0A6A6CKT5_ZASCE|nr:uncharacterized protein M409DRAFT_22651 [Zasmidium cellare ATCC 36951]KAF2167223.1 hypothetical protein M409DRAFT_22651 [Zasmidium cellare ATCC 36951]